MRTGKRIQKTGKEKREEGRNEKRQERERERGGAGERNCENSERQEIKNFFFLNLNPK